MYRIAICDDEETFRNYVIKKILELNMVTNKIEFFQFTSGEDLISSDMNFDLLFLDIQMNGIDGNDTAVVFRKHNSSSVLVFCTNYQTPLPDNFKVRPFRYIMKDIHLNNLCNELPDILVEMMNNSHKNYVVLTRDGEVNRVPTDSIMYFEVDGRYTKVVCVKGKETKNLYCREKLKYLYQEIKGVCFEYAHSSYLVNMNKIIHIEKNTIEMENGDKIYISRTKAKIFNERFKQFLNRKFRRK